MEVLKCGKVVLGIDEYKKFMDKINKLENLKKGHNLSKKRPASCVNDLPYSMPQPLNWSENNPEFVFKHETGYYNFKAWDLLLKLSKMIHEKNGLFYSYQKHNSLSYGINESIRPNKSLNFDNLSDEEFQISIDMLNDMVEVFNKYFKKTHRYIKYQSADGDLSVIKVYE